MLRSIHAFVALLFAVQLLLAASVPAPAAPAAGQVSVARDTHIAAGGLWLRLRERVDPDAVAAPQTAVLFLHGAVFPGVPTFDRDAADSWLAAALAQGLDPYALDLDGYGESMPPRTRDVASLPRALGDVSAAVAVLAATHPGGVALVGYDYGADVAALYAASHPVAKLVLVAPLLHPDQIESETVLTQPLLRSWLGTQVNDGVAERTIELALLGTRDAGSRNPPALAVPLGVFASLAAPPLSPALFLSLGVPTLLVRGRSDEVFGESEARELGAGAANVSMLELSGGHRLPWEPSGLDAGREIALFLSAKGMGVH